MFQCNGLFNAGIMLRKEPCVSSKVTNIVFLREEMLTKVFVKLEGNTKIRPKKSPKQKLRFTHTHMADI